MTSTPPMVRMRELLRDPIYRGWFLREPKLKVETLTPSWTVYVREEEGGRWSKWEAETYREGLQIVKVNLKEVHDLSLTSRRQAFQPPVVKTRSGKRTWWPGVPEGHRWCSYCRRPTLFRRFRKHHAFADFDPSPDEPRCCVCGIRRKAVTDFYGKGSR